MARHSKSRQRVRASAKQRQTGNGSSVFKPGVELKFFKPIDKSYKLDIVPYEVHDKTHADGIPVDDLWYKKPYKVHYRIGISNEKVICPRTVGKKCPICEHMFELNREEGNNKEEIMKCCPRDRELFNVIPLDHPELQKEPHIFDVSYGNFGELLDEELVSNEDENVDAFFELDIGCTLKVRFKKEVLRMNGKEYFVARSIDFMDEREDGEYTDDLLEDVYNFDDILVIRDYQDLYNLFWEITGEDENDDSESEDDSENDNSENDEEEEEKVSGPDETEEEDQDVQEDNEDEKKESDTKCPCGHSWGDVDNEDHVEDCENCPEETWDACCDYQEELKKQKRRNRRKK